MSSARGVAALLLALAGRAAGWGAAAGGEGLLAVAYQLAGRRREARELFEQLRARPDMPERFRKVWDEWIGRIAQEKASREPDGDADCTVEGSRGEA